MKWPGFAVLSAAMVLSAGCEPTDTIFIPGDAPDAPRALNAWYYAGEVKLTWELGPHWNGEPFRVYSKRSTDRDYFLVAEVTNCLNSLCSYADVNVQSNREYDYYVAAVDDYGVETASVEAIRVFVPQPTPPPVAAWAEAVALDGMNYIRWSNNARDAGDFSHYKVYIWSDDQAFFLGETDSEGFLDELAENGLTYEYYVTSVDDQGHESAGSESAFGTPRPDYAGEIVYDYFDDASRSGFIFRNDESQDPIVSGTNGLRHFRLETDADGWWLVPGPGVRVHPTAWETTALKCGPGADATCSALTEAPTSGYVTDDLFLEPQTTYVMRVPGDDNAMRYATLRVVMLGFDQSGRALMIFDWAYQLQIGNPALAPVARTPGRTRGG